MQLTDSLLALRGFYSSGQTRPYAFRLAQLKKLRHAIRRYEKDIYAALHDDLKKSPEETWVTENGMVLAELNAAIRHLKEWMQPERVRTNLLNLPSSSNIYKEPLGVVLIIGPWNYPFQLLINPLVGAIAAGNCVVLKPSEFAGATAAVIGKIIKEVFPPEYILYVEGDGAAVVPAMMNEFTFDHVFYTGSTAVGRIIYKMAAEKLVPVTLELGGKSPCIVESDADIKTAARRITVTKFSNAGQMCVAPDFVLVHESKKEELINAIISCIKKFYTTNPATSDSYGKVINKKQFDRIIGYLQHGSIVHGGSYNEAQLYIEPTLLTEISMKSSIMKEEIFGPILPIIAYSNDDEARQVIRQNPNPLAFYIYSGSADRQRKWIESENFGGGCVNNSSWHLTNHNLPFGGRGFSGTGQYHGRYSFETFSHKKAVMKTPTWFDPSIKYPPFKGKLKLFKWVIR